ncbi:hypothetical protein CPHO_00755 [Corynebacterium phocae]|uniref:Phage holin family protein n=1 Tax=Corynebacterium phocae TaxID=161895 RepID=A0A1L7D0U4_9CORY|nr:phage holin family protein [Corynebacterium phocae]APT91698.1 hypothetical protein CPHO_00755 [Corynebacterium phocae]KAA8728606.1 phage holin family protein [Corynebacterium phocae]
MSIVWNFLLNLLAVSVALWTVVSLVPGIDLEPHDLGHFGAFVSAAAIFIFVNWLVAPIVRFILGPITCLTLGLFNLVINAAMLFVVEAFFNSFGIGQFSVQGFLPAIFGAVIIGVVSSVVNFLTHPLKDI